MMNPICGPFKKGVCPKTKLRLKNIFKRGGEIAVTDRSRKADCLDQDRFLLGEPLEAILVGTDVVVSMVMVDVTQAAALDIDRIQVDHFNNRVGQRSPEDLNHLVEVAVGVITVSQEDDSPATRFKGVGYSCGTVSICNMVQGGRTA